MIGKQPVKKFDDFRKAMKNESLEKGNLAPGSNWP